MQPGAHDHWAGPGLTALRLPSAPEQRVPRRGELLIDGGLQVRAGVNAACLGDAGMDQHFEVVRLVGRRLFVRQRCRDERVEHRLKIRRRRRATKTLPQIRPVGRDDPTQPVTLLQGAKEVEAGARSFR